MSTRHHPLTSLSASELRGWLACSAYVREQAVPCTGHSTELITAALSVPFAALSRHLETLESVAEGLLAREEQQERDAERRQESLADAVAARANAVTATVTATGDRATEHQDLITPPRPIPGAAQAPRAPEPRSAVRTEERAALLAELWPTEMRPEDILNHINELDGTPCASVGALKIWAHRMGLKRENRPAPVRYRAAPPPPPAAPTPAEPPAPPAATISAPAPKPARYAGPPQARDADPAEDNAFSTEDLHEAREMLDKGHATGRQLHEYFGGTLDFWADFAAKHREQRAAA